MAKAEKPKTISGAKALLEQLKREGVDTMFGYPGAATLPIYDNLFHEKDLHHVLVRHEQGAGHMAEGYARASGRVGCVMTTSGPGATNIVTPLADALMDSTPLVAITGQVATTMIGKDAFQEADMVGITMHCTKHNFLLKDPSRLPETISQAFTIARTGRPGPVLVDLPKNMLLADIEMPEKVCSRPRSYHPETDRDFTGVDEAAALIQRSERPVLYVGGGAIHAGASEELLRLAEAAKIPVVTTLMGKGAIDETHALSMGMVGMHGTAYANWTVRHCDLLIAVGARFDDRVTGNLEAFVPDAKIIHIDIDPAEFGKVKIPHVRITGDAREALAAINEIVAPRPRTAWNDQVDAFRVEGALRYPQDGELYSQHILDALWEFTDGQSTIVTDVGQHQMWAAQYYKVRRPRQFITSGGLGTMGYGLPAAIGAKFALPDQEVWLITGDGSIQMCMQELIVASIYGLPLKVLILNNQFLGMVRQWQDLFMDRRYSHTNLEKAPDFLKLAEGHGAEAFRVEEAAEVRKALQRAREVTDGPVVVDFRVAREENVYPMIPAGGGVDQMMRG